MKKAYYTLFVSIVTFLISLSSLSFSVSSTSSPCAGLLLSLSLSPSFLLLLIGFPQNSLSLSHFLLTFFSSSSTSFATFPPGILFLFFFLFFCHKNYEDDKTNSGREREREKRENNKERERGRIRERSKLLRKREWEEGKCQFRWIYFHH